MEGTKTIRFITRRIHILVPLSLPINLVLRAESIQTLVIFVGTKIRVTVSLKTVTGEIKQAGTFFF